ncbi:MAG: NAD(P)/FAD-dependent oxidoreductase [Oscillospiraceae bacterium]|nr:NAD(P)/FAD-dependent oxidoreductase [Oscillospiraceae bacterium]
MDQYDVIIIGAGVIGCATARYLSRYDLRILVLEKEEDVCSGTSKANSGIVHAGFDALPGTMKAKMNVKGCGMIRELAETLHFPYRNNGSLLLCMDDEKLPELQKLYDRGIENGVPEMKILNAEELRKMEPAISENAIAALWAPTAGIVCPFGLTVAFAENAAENGAEFRFLTAVEKIEKQDGGFAVTTDKGTLHTRFVVNATGVHSDEFHNAVSAKAIHITPRRGEYVLMDREVGNLVNATIFPLPDRLGKGVLVSPTAHGNLLVGPNAQDIDDKADTETTQAGMDDIKSRALKSVPNIPYNKTITSFAGLRAHGDQGDFVLGEPEDCEGFFDAACVESPGLTSAPAIGEYLSDLIAARCDAAKKADFKAERKGFTEVAKLSREERSRLIAERPEYGVIVCRCENISEGEIIDAIRRTPGARSLDGIKRRVRQGMGRCQAGFCTPKAMEILARELGIPMTEITKNRPGSEMLRCDDETV